MLDYIRIKTKDQDWKDTMRSCDLPYFLVASLPPITRAKKRILVEEIDGRDGDIVTELGYSAYDKPLGIGMYGKYDFQRILDYFKPEGQVIFSNEPDKYYEYKILNNIDLQAVIRFKKGVVTFHVQPYKYSSVDRAKVLDMMYLGLKNYSNVINGINVTINNGTLKIKGTTTALTELYIPIDAMKVTSGNYQLGFNATGTGAGNVMVSIIKDTTSKTFGGSSTAMSATKNVTVSQEMTYNLMYIKINSGLSIDVTSEPFVKRLDSEMNIHNWGNVNSAPIIDIYGSGEVLLSINNKIVFIVNIPSEYEYIRLDGRTKNAYNGDTLLNRSVIGDFDNLRLKEGTNLIAWDGNVTKIVVDEYSRWI